MKLLHVTSTHLNPEGGVPVVLKKLVEEQNKIGDFEAKVISLQASVDKMESPYFDFVSLENLEKYLCNFNPDFVILHSFYYIKYNFLVRLLKKLKIRYFIEPHGSFGKEAMKKSYLKKFIAVRSIFRKQLKSAFGFVFLNEAEKNDSVFRTENDLIIPNAIDLSSISYEKSEKNDFKFYFIGRYDINHKGLDYLLDALRILETEQYSLNIEFWGSGDEESIEFIKSKIEDLKFVKVNVNSPIYGIDKDLRLEQIGPMLLTSRYEGFPMTILEAWAYGNPCLVTPGTNLSAEIIDNRLGWVAELSAADISIKIKSAREDYLKNRDFYIKNCKEYVKNNYIWSKIAEKTFNLFKSYL